ncbi:MAG: glycosyltransferase, partial [Planctomycetota bacterium]
MIERNYRENDSDIFLTIAITCYNEEKYIVNSIDTILKALRRMDFSYEIIVIDDASKDNSVQIIQQYMKTHPDSSLILQANKRNYGWAHNYVEGAFLGHGKYYKICVGDNAQPEEALVEIFKQIGKADIIITY